MKLVFFTMETTGVKDPIEPVSLGAIHVTKNNEKVIHFIEYMVPQIPIDKSASVDIHGFSRGPGDDDDDEGSPECLGRPRKLYLDGVRVPNTTSVKNGLELFVNFIEGIQSRRDERVFLVAHNCWKFESAVLLKCLLKYNIQIDYDWSNWHFLDVRDICLEFYKDKRRRVDDYKLKTIYRDLLGKKAEREFLGNALGEASLTREIVREIAFKRNYKDDERGLSDFLEDSEKVSIKEKLETLRISYDDIIDQDS